MNIIKHQLIVIIDSSIIENFILLSLANKNKFSI